MLARARLKYFLWHKQTELKKKKHTNNNLRNCVTIARGQSLTSSVEEGLKLMYPSDAKRHTGVNVRWKLVFFLLGREGEEVGSNDHGGLASDFVPVLLQTLLQGLFHENLQCKGQEVKSS